MSARCIVSLTEARATVHVLEARLNGDGDRGAEEWDIIRAQAARLVNFAKWQRDQARPAPTKPRKAAAAKKGARR
jgi:hypothetical protein